MQQLKRSVAILEALVDMIKVCDATAVLATTLRSGRMFMDAFLRRAMPFMTKNFAQHRDDVILVLNTLQKSTRALQVRDVRVRNVYVLTVLVSTYAIMRR